MAARDFEGSFCSGRKELLQFVGVLRLADSVAEQYHAVFHISRLPRMQKMAGSCQRKHVAWFCGSFLLGGMVVRSGPDLGRRKDQKENTYC